MAGGAARSARGIKLLKQLRHGLRDRTLPREDARKIFDQIDCVFLEPLIRVSCTPQGAHHGPRLPDPCELINQLNEVRQDVDRLYDGNDDLVTR